MWQELRILVVVREKSYPHEKCSALRQLSPGEKSMALPIASLVNTPYDIPSSLSFLGVVGVAPPAGVHIAPPVFAYEWSAVRVAVTTSPGTGGRTKVTPAKNAAGDTIFLPFQQNEVHSVHIQTGAAYAAGIRGFITPNLSGCRIYIDKVAGTNDLVIYHTNALAIGRYVKPGRLATDPPDPLDMDKETVARTQALDAQHTNSRAYWTSAAPGPALNAPTTIDALGVTIYYTSAVRAMQAQVNAGKTGVDFAGGVSVIGELVPGGWQISWQTYGDTTYTGPGAAKGVAAVNMTVLATGQLRAQ